MPRRSPFVSYDKHVTPNERVTDFRTFVSGVKANHLKGGLRLRQCQEEVVAILKDRVLVGHALSNDLKVCTYHAMLGSLPLAPLPSAVFCACVKHGVIDGLTRCTPCKCFAGSFGASFGASHCCATPGERNASTYFSAVCGLAVALLCCHLLPPVLYFVRERDEARRQGLPPSRSSHHHAVFRRPMNQSPLPLFSGAQLTLRP